MSFKLCVTMKSSGDKIGDYGPYEIDGDPAVREANLFFNEGVVTGLYLAGILPPPTRVPTPEDLMGRTYEDLDFQVIPEIEVPEDATTVGEVKSWASATVTHPDGTVSE